jgi:RNA polymerase sigma-70 factor (ECF subfamily)
MDLQSERDLVESSKKGEYKAFAQIYEHYYDKLLNYAYRRTLNRTASEDIVANAFVKALDNLDKFTWSEYGISPWLYRITSNELSNFFRKRNKYKFVAESYVLDYFNQGFEDRDSDEIDESLDVSMKYKHVQEVLQTINDRYQRVIHLKYFEGKSNAELSEIFGIEETSVRSLLSRALKSLKEKLAERYPAEFKLNLN